MKEITSLGNAVVKDVCNLKQKKYRERSGSFVVEGLRAVRGRSGALCRCAEDFCRAGYCKYQAGAAFG